MTDFKPDDVAVITKGISPHHGKTATVVSYDKRDDIVTVVLANGLRKSYPPHELHKLDRPFMPGDVVRVKAIGGHTGCTGTVIETKFGESAQCDHVANIVVEIRDVEMGALKLLYRKDQIEHMTRPTETPETPSRIGERVSVHDRHHPLFGQMGTVTGVAPNGTGNLIVDFDSGTRGLLISPDQVVTKADPDAVNYISTIQSLLRYWQVANTALNWIDEAVVHPGSMTKAEFITMRSRNIAKSLTIAKMRIARGIEALAQSVGYDLSEAKTVWLLRPDGMIGRVFPWDVPFDIDKLVEDTDIIYHQDGSIHGKMLAFTDDNLPITVRVKGADLE